MKSAAFASVKLTVRKGAANRGAVGSRTVKFRNEPNRLLWFNMIRFWPWKAKPKATEIRKGVTEALREKWRRNNVEIMWLHSGRDASTFFFPIDAGLQLIWSKVEEELMSWNKALIILAGVSVMLTLSAGSLIAPQARAQEGGASQEGAKKKEIKEPEKDYNQRALEIYEFKKAAKSGPERGEEIYYYKCWYCHNEYAKGAPRLDELQKRGKLISGVPVNKATVTEKIRNGGPAMPAYRATLSDGDLEDLVAFLLGGKCCFNSNSPPLNPEYRAR